MPKTAEAKAIVVDLERCLACKSCEVACASAHAGIDDIAEAVQGDAPMVTRVRVVEAGGAPVPVQCRHCIHPACVAVCPVDALSRDPDGGPVRLDMEKCIGCKGCVVACPYGAMEYWEQLESVAKCDLCEGIVGDGQEPACVAACPTRALSLGESDGS
jgi:Fe-S-cluster-containing dehydrogenase component